ncbi:hypothetical protein F511_45425 [Dorcoceras hygrometricum]|uniref:Uncharacterized protein n=1 Tax=Dorcoceras hygrometricum TaxID=472368 RepID=A0A2Z6ZW22_9LAMI|nr:hypothetical protein F511_45425 [Dorcoceras hygrometricum]
MNSNSSVIIFVKLMAQKIYLGPIALDRMTTDISFNVDLGTKKNISRKKLIAQRREAAIFVQQLVQYKDSTVGLVFIESAVGLAMETSKVESAVRNQAKAKLNQLEHGEPAGTMSTSCKRYRAK